MRTAPNKIQWTDFELMLIQKYWQKMTNKQLHQFLGKPISEHSLRAKLYELGFYKLELEYWTDEQTNWLLTRYKRYGDKEIAEIFNQKFPKNKPWTLKHIEKKRRYLNLKRTPSMIQKIKDRAIKKGTYAAGVQKMWQTRGERKEGTSVRWNKAEWIKTPNGYKLKNRYLYELKNGAIPEGYLVREIDGILKAISKAENARLNAVLRNEKKSLKIKIATTNDEWTRKHLFATKVLNFPNVSEAIGELGITSFKNQLQKYIA